MPDYQTRCAACGCETDELDDVYGQCPPCCVETEGQIKIADEIMGEAHAEAHDPDNFQEAEAADFVQEAIHYHDKAVNSLVKMGDLSEDAHKDTLKARVLMDQLSVALAELYVDVKQETP